MSPCVTRTVFLAAVLASGCGSPVPVSVPSVAGGRSDPDRVREADVSILFVGNSHTSSHDLPKLVADLIRLRRPERTVYTHVLPVGFLEDVAKDPRCAEEIETRPWKHVVLQAQKESRSGKVRYSLAEGTAFAERCKERGAEVTFYAEWGIKGVEGHAARIEALYREMATAADARVAPVGRAWELALAARPDLGLYEGDGNHQSAVGAFLTACVLAGRLTGESPAGLAAYAYPAVGEADRRFLAEKAAEALRPDAGGDGDG